MEFNLHDNANEVVNEFFESLIARYQIGLETSMRGSEFKFSIQFNYCVVNTNDKCFQYALTVALNFLKIMCNPKRVSNSQPYLNKSN